MPNMENISSWTDNDWLYGRFLSAMEGQVPFGASFDSKIVADGLSIDMIDPRTKKPAQSNPREMDACN